MFPENPTIHRLILNPTISLNYRIMGHCLNLPLLTIMILPTLMVLHNKLPQAHTLAYLEIWQHIFFVVTHDMCSGISNRCGTFQIQNQANSNKKMSGSFQKISAAVPFSAWNTAYIYWLDVIKLSDSFVSWSWLNALDHLLLLCFVIVLDDSSSSLWYLETIKMMITVTIFKPLHFSYGVIYRVEKGG